MNCNIKKYVKAAPLPKFIICYYYFYLFIIC